MAPKADAKKGKKEEVCQPRDSLSIVRESQSSCFQLFHRLGVVLFVILRVCVSFVCVLCNMKVAQKSMLTTRSSCHELVNQELLLCE
jgi:hypothetical protein